MRLLLVLLVATAFAESPQLSKSDEFYLHRDEPGKLERSIELMKAAPAGPEADWRLARALIAQASGAPDKKARLALLDRAAEAARRSVAAAPKDARAHYWLARELGAENELRRKLGLAKEMKRELEASLALDGSSAAAHQTYGELLRQLPGLFGGDKKKAVAELEKAVSLGPFDPGRWVALAEAYLAVDNEPAAKAALKRALAIEKPEDPASFEGDLKAARGLLDSLK